MLTYHKKLLIYFTAKGKKNQNPQNQQYSTQ